MDKTNMASVAGLIHTNPMFAYIVFQTIIVVFIYHTNQNQTKHTLI